MSTEQAVYREVLRAGGEAVAAAGRRDLDAAVPSCPGWTVHRLLAHLGRVYRSVGRHVAERATEMIPADQIPRPPAESAAILEWFEQGHRFVQEALDGAGPDEAVWSWADQHTVAFYVRRMAHETEIHRWDAEAAFGEPSPIDSDLGADGVSELFEVLLPFAPNWDAALPDASLHLHRTDGAGEWLLVNDGGSVKVSRQHAKGDAAVRASGGDLMLLAWGRIGLDSPGVEAFGDADAARAWLALSR